MQRTFVLAPMSPTIAVVTVFVWLLPLLFGVLAVSNGLWILGVTALFLLTIYIWVWLWFRPTQFTIVDESIEIQFPLRRRSISKAHFIDVRAIDFKDFQAEAGWAVRIGVGGLWGGFGWLWTHRRGMVEFYISRLDGFVFINRTDGYPLLITPVNPHQFVEALRQKMLTPRH